MEHKVAQFSAVIVLWTIVSLLIKLIHILLKWKYIAIHGEDILSEKFRPAYLARAGVFIWEIFFPVTEISVAKPEI